MWREVAALAERQHGVVARDQLRGLGVSEATIDWAIVSGRLFPLFRGIFALGHAGVGRNGRLLAATLACGEGSVVSHGTAAALLGIWDRHPRQIDVIAPVQAGRKIPGIRRRHTPPPGEIHVHDAVPCTGPSRTIVDVAGIVGEQALRRTVEQTAVLRVLNVPEIDAILAEGRRRGGPRLRSVLEDWRRYPPTMRLRSPMEARLLPHLSRRGISMPECNEVLKIAGRRFEVDFLWRRQRFVLEVDGARYHDNPEARSRDAHRDRMLSAAGYDVWRIGWHDLEQRLEKTMFELARRLERA